MYNDSHFHYLIRAAYQPRVAATGMAIIITLSHYYGEKLLPSWALLLTMFAMLYPHLAYWASGLCINTAAVAQRNLTIDGALVGALIVATEYYLISAVTFVVALVFSTAVMARPIILVQSLCMLLFVVSSTLLAGFSIDYENNNLTNILCSVLLILYGGLVAYYMFLLNSKLRASRLKAEADTRYLQGFTENLKRYISPQLYGALSIADLASDIGTTNKAILKEKPTNKTSRKQLTIFFSDIEGFTELMDNLDEETVTQILNEYLNTMADIAVEYGGTIDKFMGDGIMIFFGDPDSKGAKQDATNCLRMSLQMSRSLKSLRERWQQDGIYSDLHMRIGVNTGYCAVGNFGSQNRLDYTAIGSTVNIASRLESKAGRDAILISESTYLLVRDTIECHEQLPLSVKGIARTIKNYLALGERADSRLALIEKEIMGLSVSINPASLDIAKAKGLLLEVDATLNALSRAELETSTMVRMLR